ncbi:MAG: alpha/beta fold hydrolase [Actinotalea sp.]|nr:alpha/beta fold hydrolase [Actinotalea sp.]
MTPIVFVHGTRTSSTIWQAQVAAMTALGHECRTVDLPGHGARHAERFTLPGAVRAIDDAVRATGVPPLLVGLSLGGYASLAYAAQHQRAVAGIVLSGCSTEIRGMPLAAYRVLSARAARVLRPRDRTWHVVTDMLTAMQGYSAVADLRRLHVPVWLVNGERDLMRLSERRFLAARPGTRLDVVRRAGHDVNSHAPAAFNRILVRVVEELRTAFVPVAAT